jgi:4-amino-4-deoxy-L-arabinose transferase-like glycosyltransferase
MVDLTPHKTRDLSVLAILSLVLFGVSLGARDLWNPNEPIYGEAVREMSQRGTWLVPYVNGRVFGEKPILYYWMALAASRLAGGVSELPLRVPVALAGIAIVLGVYALVFPYSGRRGALSSAIVCATIYGIWWNARFIQMDILVTATTLGVIAAVTRAVDHGTSRAKAWALAGAIAGIGFLAKGPVAWVCPGLVVTTYLVVTKRAREMVRPELLLGGIVAIVVAAPWYVALWTSGRTDVLHEVLIRQNFSRFSNPWDHAQPFWYYLENFWIDMAPWAFFVPLAWKLTRRDDGEERLAVLCLCWILAIVTFFSLSRSKRSPYVLPIAPAVAILAAEVAVAYAEDRLTRARRTAFLWISWVLAILLILAGIGVVLFAIFHHPELASAARPLGAAALAGGVVLAVALSLRRFRSGIAVPAALATAFALFYLIASATALPALDDAKSARPFCEAVAARSEPGDDVVSFDFWNWRAEYAYYLGRPLRPISGAPALKEAWDGPKRLLVVVEEDRLAAARQAIGDVEPAYARRIGGRVTYLFTNRASGSAPRAPE